MHGKTIGIVTICSLAEAFLDRYGAGGLAGVDLDTAVAKRSAMAVPLIAALVR